MTINIIVLLNPETIYQARKDEIQFAIRED
jgi:hypothetical protein